MWTAEGSFQELLLRMAVLFYFIFSGMRPLVSSSVWTDRELGRSCEPSAPFIRANHKWFFFFVCELALSAFYLKRTLWVFCTPWSRTRSCRNWGRIIHVALLSTMDRSKCQEEIDNRTKEREEQFLHVQWRNPSAKKRRFRMAEAIGGRTTARAHVSLARNSHKKRLFRGTNIARPNRLFKTGKGPQEGRRYHSQ